MAIRARRARRRRGTVAAMLLRPEVVAARTLYRDRRSRRHAAEIEDRPDSRRTALVSPKHLNLASNYVDTISFILNLQHFLNVRPNRKRRTKYLDFADLETIDLGALLMIAAELDTHLGPYSKQGRQTGDLRDADTHLWSPSISYLFQHFGIFDLVGYKPTQTLPRDAVQNIEVVKFRRNVLIQPKVAFDLIDDIGKLSPTRDENQRSRMYEALVEAMSNTTMHAYPKNSYMNYPGRTLKYWWGGALYDKENEQTVFVLFDRGIGLPKTIPSRPWIRTLIDPQSASDAALISVALTQSRSQTGLPQHGKGLPQMADAVDLREGSELRILSGKGIVVYRGKDKITEDELPIDIGGSLIQWVISERGAP